MIDVLLCQAVARLACSPCAVIADWAIQQMHFSVVKYENIWVIQNPAVDYQAVIDEDLDPISRAISLASVIAGPSGWPSIFPGLVDVTRQEQKMRPMGQGFITTGEAPVSKSHKTRSRAPILKR